MIGSVVFLSCVALYVLATIPYRLGRGRGYSEGLRRRCADRYKIGYSEGEANGRVELIRELSDNLMYVGRGRNRRVWLSVNPSDIPDELASRMGIVPEVE